MSFFIDIKDLNIFERKVTYEIEIDLNKYSSSFVGYLIISFFYYEL